MKLAELLDGTGVDCVDRVGSAVIGLAVDSRSVMPGYLFTAVSGTQADGAAYVEDAVRNGASVIISSQPLQGVSIPVLTHANPRLALALCARNFFSLQPKHISAVTGTNGKTSVAEFVRQLYQAAQLPSASIGTLGVSSSQYWQPLAHTTPDPIQLHAVLRDLFANQIDHVAIEASSHGLAQFRLDGVQVKVAGFTNLSRDHMDYHSDYDDYFSAKARLFSDILAPDGTAVIYISSPAGQKMAEHARANGRHVLEVGMGEGELQISILNTKPNGQDVRITYQENTSDIFFPVAGDFQVANLCVAIGIVIQSGLSFDQAVSGVASLSAPTGRMERVGITSAGASVYVDYAHTPDALETALTSARAHVGGGGKIRLVFGCGGDRDAGKRAEMASIAQRLADDVFVTDDNPRHEDPAKIRQAILAECSGAIDVADRAEAIRQAIAGAGCADIVLVTGKGHETGQLIGDETLPFSDIEFAISVLNETGGKDE